MGIILQAARTFKDLCYPYSLHLVIFLASDTVLSVLLTSILQWLWLPTCILLFHQNSEWERELPERWEELVLDGQAASQTLSCKSCLFRL